MFSDLVPDRVTRDRSDDDDRQHEPKIDVTAAGEHPTEDCGCLAGQHEADEKRILSKDQNSDQNVGQERVDIENALNQAVQADRPRRRKGIWVSSLISRKPTPKSVPIRCSAVSDPHRC
jgi:hypothetical protein